MSLFFLDAKLIIKFLYLGFINLSIIIWHAHNIFFFVKQFKVSLELDFYGLIFCGFLGIGERMQN